MKVVPRVLAFSTPGPNPAFNDFAMQNLIPPNGRSEILATDNICKSTQRKPNVTDYSPMLQISASSKLLLRYQENGHVTLRYRDDGASLPRKPTAGTVWVYGTNRSSQDDKIMSIHGVWNKDGTGGDGRGILLAEAPFDDGECYQVNESEESVRRQALPQRRHTEREGRDLWCGIALRLPSDLQAGTNYTLYWVWSWPTLLNEQPQQWEQEIYTSCMDIEIL